MLIEPEAPHLPGIDETRRGRPRWIKNEATGRWARTELFGTNFTDLPGSGGLLGQAVGRTGEAVVDRLNTRGQGWKNQVRIVAIDPAACYRTAIRQALPHAVTVVDHFHLVALASKTLTGVRPRITRTKRGRRGRATDPAWANRRRLPACARERAPHSVLSPAVSVPALVRRLRPSPWLRRSTPGGSRHWRSSPPASPTPAPRRRTG
ncbi:transposase [Streptosporangium sp. NPDC006007]|uniref:transposase n=1 Tax=Streptosporangium sp. NPDC006007 TaxID=3154575 RepID=UPI0033A5076B